MKKTLTLIAIICSLGLYAQVNEPFTGKPVSEIKIDELKDNGSGYYYDHYSSFQKRPVTDEKIVTCYKIMINPIINGVGREVFSYKCDSTIIVNDSLLSIKMLSEMVIDQSGQVYKYSKEVMLQAEILKYIKVDGSGVEPRNRKKFKEAVTNYQLYIKNK